MGRTRTQNGILFEFFFCENSSANLIIINSLVFQCFTTYHTNVRAGLYYYVIHRSMHTKLVVEMVSKYETRKEREKKCKSLFTLHIVLFSVTIKLNDYSIPIQMKENTKAKINNR